MFFHFELLFKITKILNLLKSSNKLKFAKVSKYFTEGYTSGYDWCIWVKIFLS